MSSWVPVENAVERVGFAVEGVCDNQKRFLPEAEELPVHCTEGSEEVCSNDKRLTWQQIGLIYRKCPHNPPALHYL